MSKNWAVRVTALLALGASLLTPYIGYLSYAHAASMVVNREAMFFEQTIGNCSGQTTNTCVGEAFQSFATRVSRSDIEVVAPQALQTLQQASTTVRAAKTKPAATSALNRIQSTVRNLAARSSGEANQVYSRISQAVARAQAVIAAGG